MKYIAELCQLVSAGMAVINTFKLLKDLANSENLTKTKKESLSKHAVDSLMVWTIIAILHIYASTIEIFFRWIPGYFYVKGAFVVLTTTPQLKITNLVFSDFIVPAINIIMEKVGQFQSPWELLLLIPFALVLLIFPALCEEDSNNSSRQETNEKPSSVCDLNGLTSIKESSAQNNTPEEDPMDEVEPIYEPLFEPERDVTLDSDSAATVEEDTLPSASGQPELDIQQLEESDSDSYTLGDPQKEPSAGAGGAISSDAFIDVMDSSPLTETAQPPSATLPVSIAKISLEEFHSKTGYCAPEEASKYHLDHEDITANEILVARLPKSSTAPASPPDATSDFDPAGLVGPSSTVALPLDPVSSTDTRPVAATVLEQRGESEGRRAVTPVTPVTQAGLTSSASLASSAIGQTKQPSSVSTAPPADSAGTVAVIPRGASSPPPSPPSSSPPSSPPSAQSEKVPPSSPPSAQSEKVPEEVPAAPSPAQILTPPLQVGKAQHTPARIGMDLCQLHTSEYVTLSCALLCCTVMYFTVLYHTVLYCTVLLICIF